MNDCHCFLPPERGATRGAGGRGRGSGCGEAPSARGSVRATGVRGFAGRAACAGACGLSSSACKARTRTGQGVCAPGVMSYIYMYIYIYVCMYVYILLLLLTFPWREEGTEPTEGDVPLAGSARPDRGDPNSRADPPREAPPHVSLRSAPSGQTAR